MTKTLVLNALVLALFTVPTSAQSLADAAKKAEEQRAKAAKPHDEKTTTDKDAAAAKKVYTNKDLPAVAETSPTPPPAATPEPSPSAFAAAVNELNAIKAPEPTTGPTVAQLHEIELTKARKTLRESKQALREAEETQRDLQRTYDNTCSDPHGYEMIRNCADIRYTLRYTSPEAIRGLRDSIRELEALLAR